MEMMAIDDSLPAQPANPAAIASLRLVELYRYLKTGHTAEAIELFGQHLPQMRSGLGHRVAEAHALAALAYDRASRPLEAQQHFADAMKTRLQTTLDDLQRLQNKQIEQLELRLERQGGLENLKQGRRVQRENQIRKVFDEYEAWVRDTLQTEPHPYIQVLAAVCR